MKDSRKTLLVVEDDPGLQKALRWAFSLAIRSDSSVRGSAAVVVIESALSFHPARSV